MLASVASCRSWLAVAVASAEKNTRNPLTNASRAVVSQHRLVITPVTITSSTPIRRSASSSPVPAKPLYVLFSTTRSPSRRPEPGRSSAAGVPSAIRSPGHHSSSGPLRGTGSTWRV
ncbi:Os04g0525850 [Oryza sativa Japonica Group]|uniref:Os04g0525850 protein n=1 Tax=Oryza sativa subsp. japonica TaxID=39947 RepID=A0A0P0WCW7_ORYSJ|nr:hypothetical protein EE612_024519 [Oryza sativa]BAS90165.1 Os04g0525850 [Oryza sativa Japonica Group]